MGIFTVPTVSVRKTRIYVSPSPALPGEQLTIYKTEVNTMLPGGFLILPVPYAQTVRFHHPRIPASPNQSPYLEFLDRVENAFGNGERRHTFPRPRVPGSLATFENIDILESIEELRVYNDREHILHESTLNQIAEIYHQPYWGFLLCSLHQGACIYEPICYTHRMIGQEMFIPSLIYQPRRFNDVDIPEESDRFDDRYFMNGCYYSEPMGYRLQEVDLNRIHSIPWGTLPHNYRECLRNFLSESRRGTHWNNDSMYRINESLYEEYHPRQRRYSDEMYSPITPW